MFADFLRAEAAKYATVIKPQDGVLKFFTNLDESLMGRLQREFPKARLVKAFSSVGNALGCRGHGQGECRARHRAAVHAVVHPGIPAQRVDARLQAAASVSLLQRAG